MKWKVIALVSLLVAVGVTVTGMTSSLRGKPTSSRLDRVLRENELRVCSTGDYRPFTFRDSAGRWSGIDIGMARDLAQRLGVRMTMVPTTWDSLMDDFPVKCDIAVGGVSVTLERAQEAMFSDAYLEDGKAPITRCEDADRFRTLEQIDQPGVRVIVNPGGTNEEFARQNLERATIVEHSDNNTIFERILAGKADLMITDAAETRWHAKQNPELCATSPDQPFTYSEKAYLLPRGDFVFQHWVNQWLNLAMHDGTYARVSRPWVG